MLRTIFKARSLFNPSVSRFGSGFDRIAESNDATSICLESISGTIKGLQKANYVVEHNPNLTSEEKKNLKQFLVYRYNPADPHDQPKYVSYWVDIKKFPPMFLDAILYIKNELDPTLSIRRSCREGICGSCAVNCDGLHTLACISGFNRDLSKPTFITPLGHMFILKDLVVDMTNFYAQYKMIEPYLKRKTPKPEANKEYPQSPEQRALLDGLYECVLCAACSTSCPSYWWHPDRYLGPAILQQAYRWIVDSRDEYTQERIERIAEDVRLDDCQQIGMCSFTCPKGLNPQLSLKNLMDMVKDFRQKRIEQEVL
ncbi:hypothetical protein ABPG72_014324 [Tetrahymena utriculariae]